MTMSDADLDYLLHMTSDARELKPMIRNLEAELAEANQHIIDGLERERSLTNARETALNKLAEAMNVGRLAHDIGMRQAEAFDAMIRRAIAAFKDIHDGNFHNEACVNSSSATCSCLERFTEDTIAGIIAMPRQLTTP